ncbi:MAG: dihydropteroate synthase [Puniceicoccales bacterium]|jgi:dihydropteroate synthase|nr:dihydropteroate synthase [Puniceicoccales bacterium]
MNQNGLHRRPIPAPGARTLLMGIVNVTPDSFSDGGQYTTAQAAATHARALADAGADVLDLGAESTRPGHDAVDTATELARLLPALQAIRAVLPDIPVSVDTYKADVAQAAIEAGADIINDIWGGLHAAGNGASPMCAVAARFGVPIILMHNRTHPVDDSVFWETYLDELRHSVGLARDAGVPDSQIWLDPGFGFGKTPAQNLECLRQLDRVVALGFPVLLGTSRKSTLGLVLDAPVAARQEGNTATAVWGIAHGAAMLRMHDVAATQPAVRMADAIRAGLHWRNE